MRLTMEALDYRSFDLSRPPAQPMQVINGVSSLTWSPGEELKRCEPRLRRVTSDAVQLTHLDDGALVAS
jgi:hypothetical protein